MTTFDLTEVTRFTADLEARMVQADNGEGMECHTLDLTLQRYAELCCEFREGVRQWGRAVFSGKVPFDAEVDRALHAEAKRLHTRAIEMLAYARIADTPCFGLPGRTALEAAVLYLQNLLNPWVTPKLSVGPAARLGLPLSPAAEAEAKRRLAALPPLPADWEPADPRQRQLYRKLKGR